MPDSETELVQRAQAADIEAFAELAGRYERRIYSLALHYCHDLQDAEDLSQEVWLKAYRSISTFKGESSFYTWIRRITINCFLNRERAAFTRWRALLVETKNDSSQHDVVYDANVENTLHNRIMLASVRRALRGLTPQQRLIFLLKHHEGMTYPEIAKAVGCSEGTAKKAVARALTKLREQMQVEVKANDGVPCVAGEY